MSKDLYVRNSIGEYTTLAGTRTTHRRLKEVMPFKVWVHLSDFSQHPHKAIEEYVFAREGRNLSREMCYAKEKDASAT